VRRVAGLRGRRDAERLEHEVPEPVEEIHERLGRQVERPHRRRERQRHRARAGDRGALGRELAEDHVQDGDDREREHGRQAESGHARGVAEQRLEQVVEGGLADRAEAQRGERDPELARRQVRVDVVHGVLRRLRPRLPLAHELGHLGRAQPRDRELGADEEAVGGDEPEGDQQLNGHACMLAEPACRGLKTYISASQ
jgi:hypothetical protein